MNTKVQKVKAREAAEHLRTAERLLQEAGHSQQSLLVLQSITLGVESTYALAAAEREEQRERQATTDRLAEKARDAAQRRYQPPTAEAQEGAPMSQPANQNTADRLGSLAKQKATERYGVGR